MKPARFLLLILISAALLFAAEPGFAVLLDESEIVDTKSAEPEAARAQPTPESDPAEPGEPRPINVAVLNFSDGAYAPGIGRAVSDMIIGSIADDPLISVFERARLDEIIYEQNRTNPSDTDGNTIRAARQVGVQFVITGKVSEFGINENGVLIPGKGTVTQYRARATLDIRLINVADASIIQTWTTTGGDSSYNLGINILGIPNFSFSGRQFEESLLGKATRKAVDSAAVQIRTDVRGPLIQGIAASVKLTGKVADVEDGEIILNIGAPAGAKKGMDVNIYRLEKQVRDPDTGELLMEKRVSIGYAIITLVEDKYSKAVIMETSDGADVRVGDVVESAGSGDPGQAAPKPVSE